MLLFAALLVDHYLPVGMAAKPTGVQIELTSGTSGQAQ
jgi:hypothetical protein